MPRFLACARSYHRPLTIERLESRWTPAVTWDVRFDDFRGEHAEFYQPIRETLMAAAQEWGRYMPKAKASIQLAVRFDDLDHLANAGSATSVFWKRSGKFEVWDMSVSSEIRTGKDPNKGKADGVIRIDSASLFNDYWFDPTPANREDEDVPSNKLDAYSILLHEVGHILGIDGWRDWTTGIPSGNDLSRFDQSVTIAADGTPYFTGPAARVAYGGKWVPLTHTNLYHVGNDTFGTSTGSGRPGADLLADVMNGVSTEWGRRERISPVDIAILKDIGLPVIVPKNTAPVIADVADQIMAAGGFLELPIAISDRETPVAGLQLTVFSNNTELRFQNGLDVSGTGAQRTLLIDPPEGFRGSAVVTLMLSDGNSTVSEQFLLTVRANHRPPTLSAMPIVSLEEDTAQVMQVFITPGDLPIDAASMRATSTNTMLFPPGSLSIHERFDGAVFLTLSPAANRNTSLDGVALVELSVSDGVTTVKTSIEVTVRALNDRPTVVPVADLVIPFGGSRDLTVVVADTETSLEELTVVAFALDASLFSPQLIPVQRVGTEHRITLLPRSGAEGASLIELMVNDGLATTMETFEVRVTSDPFPWHNASSRFDVNNDGVISGLDALIVINALNDRGPGPLNSSGAAPLNALCDVDPDNELKAIDALLVINFLNERIRQRVAAVLP